MSGQLFIDGLSRRSSYRLRQILLLADHLSDIRNFLYDNVYPAISF